MSENKGKIIYALVASGAKPLAGYSNYTGTFDQACVNYLKNIGPGTSAAVKVDDYVIFYINDSNITYLIMADNLYPKEAAIGCLESIKKEFVGIYQNRTFENVSNFGLNDEFKVKLRMKFDYFNANTDVSNEALEQLKEHMNKMKDEVINASGLLQNRGEKLQVLSENADALSSASNNYYKSSKKVKRAECMKKVKIYGAIAVAVIIIIILLILIFN